MRVLEYVLASAGTTFAAVTVVCIILRMRGRLDHWPEWAANTIGSGCLAAYWILYPSWPWAVLMILSAAGSAWMWWRYWRRRKRRRATALFGAKSRALRERLVRTMRRERRPSRVLRPHPVPS